MLSFSPHALLLPFPWPCVRFPAIVVPGVELLPVLSDVSLLQYAFFFLDEPFHKCAAFSVQPPCAFLPLPPVFWLPLRPASPFAPFLQPLLFVVAAVFF
jgi:hypothetical protein